MPQRHFKDWLTAFMEYASYGEAPFKMIFWTGISTLAGALRRRVWIDQHYWQWLPNFYIIFVAPPGIVSKTTTANIGMNLLKGLPPGSINFGPDVVTWQSLITSLAKSGESVPDPRNPGVFHPMSCVTFCSDELGNLLNPNDPDLVAALITLWDGKQGAFRKETKTSGSDKIENPWINIIGCTTPSWIAGNVPEYIIGGGFTSRCVFIYADKKRQLVPLVSKAVPPGFDDLRKKLIHDLEIISMMFGEYTITSQAEEWNARWYKEHWEGKPLHINSELYSGYMARKQTHLFKLAMIISASKDDSLLIEPEHLNVAQDCLTAIEEDMPKIFSRIGQTDITRSSTEILFIVEANPGIPQPDLYRAMFRTQSYKDFLESLSGAINSLQIVSRQEGNTIRYYPVKIQDEHQNRKVH